MPCRKRRDDVKAAGSRYCGNNSGATCLRTEWHPALRWPELAQRQLSGTWEPGTSMLTEKPQVEAPRRRRPGTEQPGELKLLVLAEVCQTRGNDKVPSSNNPNRALPDHTQVLPQTTIPNYYVTIHQS